MGCLQKDRVIANIHSPCILYILNRHFDEEFRK